MWFKKSKKTNDVDEKKIMEFIKKEEVVTLGIIIKKFKIRYDSAKEILNKLVDEKKIKAVRSMYVSQ
jgi:ferritin